jgi:hypothetical protein
MFNLLDLMRAAQGGAAMNNMARQFGVSVEQTQRAMEALMPAFALGFQRNATNPMGFANLLGMMGSGQYASFFDQPKLAFTPRAWSEGNQVLGQLFGHEVSRQVAEQTAAWAGIAPEIMKQMMPTVAAMLMGGLFRSAASEGLADLFEQFARALRGEAPGAAPRPRGRQDAPAALNNPFEAWAGMLEAMWGQSPAAAKPEPDRAPADQMANPFAPWAAMMSAMLVGAQETAPAVRESPAPPKQPSPQDPFDFFAGLMESGRDVQQQHMQNLQHIFDAYWGNGSKKR